jgi:hypothetical protein
MRDNDICIHELLDRFDVLLKVDIHSVIGFITNGADPHELEEIINLAARKMKSDYYGMAGRLSVLEDNQ